MSEENSYEGKGPCSYIVMALELQEFEGNGRVKFMYVACDAIRGWGWFVGNDGRRSRRLILRRGVLYEHTKHI